MPSFDPQSISAITFDLYGTLLDLEATFEPGFDAFFRERGAAVDTPRFVQTWEVHLPPRGHGRHFPRRPQDSV